MKYDPWQKQVLEAKGHILLNKGRQIGGTEIFAHKASEYIINHPNHQIVCVSLTLDQAENIITMVLNYLNKKYPKLILKGKNKPTKTRVWVKGNGHIISRPVGNTGDSIRTFTGNVLYADEASRLPRAFWVAAKAILFTTAGKIWMSSTPAGKFEGKEHTYYYETYLNKHGRFEIIEQNSEWVANNREVCETWTQEQKDGAIQHLVEEKEAMSKSEYAQEYMHQFQDDLQQWFDDDLIRSRMIAKRPKPEEIDKDWFVGQGNDIARKGLDPGSYEVFRLRDDHLIQLENQISKDQPITTTADQIIGLDEKFHGDKIFIDDEGSLGKGVLDILLKDDRTKYKTIGISNSKRIIDKNGKLKGIKKTELYVTLLSLMEKGKIDLLDDESIFQSLKSVQFCYETDSNGVRHLKIFGNDTHITEGITRGTELLKYKDLNPTIYTIKV